VYTYSYIKIQDTPRILSPEDKTRGILLTHHWMHAWQRVGEVNYVISNLSSPSAMESVVSALRIHLIAPPT